MAKVVTYKVPFTITRDELGNTFLDLDQEKRTVQKTVELVDNPDVIIKEPTKISQFNSREITIAKATISPFSPRMEEESLEAHNERNTQRGFLMQQLMEE